MAKDIEYVANLNLLGNEIRNVVVEVVKEAPTSDALGKTGRIVSFGGNLYISDGVNFSKLGSAGDVSSLTSRISAVEAENASQNTSIQQNSTDIATNTGAISGLDTRLGSVESKIATAEGEIDALQSDMTTAKNNISSLKTTVEDAETGLVKKVNDNTAAIALKANKAEVYTTGQVDNIKTELEGKINNKADVSSVYTTGQIDSKLAGYYLKTETYSKTEIDKKVEDASTKAYKVRGSVTNYADLPESEQVEGDVYNVLNAFQIGSDKYPAGTNVVWTGSAWDPLGGIVDLSPYALSTTVTTLDTTLRGLIADKVDQSEYDARVTAVDTALGLKATKTELNEGLAKKVDSETYATDKSALESAIAGKAKKVATGEGTWTGKITVNEEGIVTHGENLAAADIPKITADKISDFAATVKTVRFQHSYSTDQTTLTIEHNLGVEWPQVTVYNTTSKAIIYADVVYTDANNVQISGNMPLNAITVVVSP